MLPIIKRVQLHLLSFLIFDLLRKFLQTKSGDDIKYSCSL